MDKNVLNGIYASIKEFNKAYKTLERAGKDMDEETITVRATTAKNFVDSMKRLADELQKVM